MSWNDARAYDAWAGLELPTEARWERAAAWDPVGGRSRPFPWGDETPGKSPGAALGNLSDRSSRDKYKVYAILTFNGYIDGFADPCVVGSFPRGASLVGALDMVGNVTEWVQDSYDPGFYERSPRREPCCTEGQERVMRGGGAWSIPQMAGTHVRLKMPPTSRYGDVGLRVARSARG